MRVGVPKEIKPNEHRIGLTPTAVREENRERTGGRVDSTASGPTIPQRLG